MSFLLRLNLSLTFSKIVFRLDCKLCMQQPFLCCIHCNEYALKALCLVRRSVHVHYAMCTVNLLG